MIYPDEEKVTYTYNALYRLTGATGTYQMRTAKRQAIRWQLATTKCTTSSLRASALNPRTVTSYPTDRTQDAYNMQEARQMP